MTTSRTARSAVAAQAMIVAILLNDAKFCRSGVSVAQSCQMMLG